MRISLLETILEFKESLFSKFCSYARCSMTNNYPSHEFRIICRSDNIIG